MKLRQFVAVASFAQAGWLVYHDVPFIWEV
jgi:hypothetical protein